MYKKQKQMLCAFSEMFWEVYTTPPEMYSWKKKKSNLIKLHLALLPFYGQGGHEGTYKLCHEGKGKLH